MGTADDAAPAQSSSSYRDRHIVIHHGTVDTLSSGVDDDQDAQGHQVILSEKGDVRVRDGFCL